MAFHCPRPLGLDRDAMIEEPAPSPVTLPPGPATRGIAVDRAMSDGGVSPSPPLSTFLITDIEGSTRLWEERADAMATALARHDGLLRTAVDGRGGTIIKTTGDGVLAVFDDPATAVAAALDGQRALRDAAWGE